MHVNAKKMAFGGLMLALTEVCITLGSVIETNTLFLLAAASFFVGIAVQETNLKGGGAFYLAGVLLGVIVSPNKLYVVSYAAMGFYILVVEFTWKHLSAFSKETTRIRMLWIVKYLTFNLMYLPSMYFLKELLFPLEFTAKVWILYTIIGQAGLWIYDRAYEYFMGQIWKKIKAKLV